MIGPTRHSLTQRLDRLERERHCWRGAAVLLAVTVVALVNLGAATPQPSDVRARSLTILDGPATQASDWPWTTTR